MQFYSIHISLLRFTLKCIQFELGPPACLLPNGVTLAGRDFDNLTAGARGGLFLFVWTFGCAGINLGGIGTASKIIGVGLCLTTESI